VAVDVGTGLTDAERERPPAIGARITIKYQELTPAGVPRFPVFVAVRNYE
jgi:DNA ligase-1